MKNTLTRRGGKLWERERPGLLFLLIFALVFLRFCYYGLEYFPQLDDYIQMYNQPAFYSFTRIVLDMGLLASRPLASVMDYAFWSHFWPCMIAAVALISALYAASACLFRRVWGEYFGTGYVFLAVYALLPLGMEGTYWISASNRVVPSLFFIALAMRLFQRWCTGGKRRFLILYFLTQLVSFCFYEQGLVLSITGVLLVGILEFFRQRRRALFSLLTFVNVIIYFLFTSAFSTGTGQLGSRLKLTLPWQEGWGEVFSSAARQTGTSFLLGGYKTLFRGFRRGLECIFAELNPLWLLLLVIFCILLFFCTRRFTVEGKRPVTALIVGFLMALAPITLFFVLSNPSIALRNTVFSFCGIALAADALFNMIFRGVRARNLIAGILCAVFAFGASVCAVSELHDYRETYLADQRAAAAITDALGDGDGISAAAKVGIIGLQSDYLPEQNFKYHEHIHGATESVWGLTGLLMYKSDNPNFPYCTPLPTGQEDLSGFDILLIYDHETGTARRYTPEMKDSE